MHSLTIKNGGFLKVIVRLTHPAHVRFWFIFFSKCAVVHNAMMMEIAFTGGIFHTYKEKSSGTKSMLNNPREKLADIRENIRQ